MREEQEVKQKAEETKQEADGDSVKTAEDTEFNTQFNNGKHKDSEPSDDMSSQGKPGVTNVMCRLLSTV